jgi:hypothetical protein
VIVESSQTMEFRTQIDMNQAGGPKIATPARVPTPETTLRMTSQESQIATEDRAMKPPANKSRTNSQSSWKEMAGRQKTHCRVGPRGLEPRTSSLSGTRSNRAELWAQFGNWEVYRGSPDRARAVMWPHPQRLSGSVRGTYLVASKGGLNA